MNQAKEIIKKLNLKPHPEGGYFREIYRSVQTIRTSELPRRFEGNRNICTSIYFLLEGTQVSCFHKLKSDEIWHFYRGSSAVVHRLKGSEYSQTIVGSNIKNGDTTQLIIKAGTWFAAEVKNKRLYSLIGCTVAPGFDFADFRLAKRSKLLKKFPQHQEIIYKFTKA